MSAGSSPGLKRLFGSFGLDIFLVGLGIKGKVFSDTAAVIAWASQGPPGWRS
jgi:hypothetical protein